MTPDPDDDRTVFDGSARPLGPPSVGSADRLDNPLPVGTRLAEFEIVGLVGVGGFSFVYLAQDHSLGRRVALKEYMPQSLAARGEGALVSVRSARHAETFEAGRRSFVNEARLLAQFDHPSLVKVYRFWEGNGTAYMAMSYCAGRTLKDRLKEMSGPPDQAWLERLLAPVLDALECLHAAQVFHRDIAPDNIMLMAGDRPVLLDFGAARHVIADMSQALTVILKSGYAPIEQYAEVPDLKQGAWTDIYALAAVIYFSITGTRPLPAVGRMLGDRQEPLASKSLRGAYSKAFLDAIDGAQAVMPKDRPQSVSEMRERLGLRAHASATAHGESIAGNSSSNATESGSAVAHRSRSRVWTSAALAIVVAAAIGAAFWRSAATKDAPTARRDETIPVASASSPVASSSLASTARVPPTTVAWSPLGEIDRIFEQRNPDHTVSVAAERSQVTIGRDKLRFNVFSARAGYLYVLMVGTDRRNFWLLFPNQADSDNRIQALGRLELPRKSWELQVAGPPGIDRFVAIVSENRRDFNAAGWVRSDIFGEFPLDAAANTARTANQPTSPFLGTPICADTASTCSSAYGAAVFSIEEIEAVSKPRQ